ncbi:UDP-4-amino-4,6-dideoxy-N-acetyl-beta-L-altrosamine transaminase [Thalassospira sp. SN3W]|uniref:UDP-4-amino-4, 6-dideoxy-N-acetyl-beta-L-altrosamine transaminase n=1 Tax=Thalassospira sp. SN3W TaxID=3035476 RepID=UPI00311B21F1
MIPYGRQDISEEDINAVVNVLRSDWLTQGPCVPRFEAALAEYTGASHAIAVNSATSALHIACLALGVGPGDWVWTSPNTFVASANCAEYCGANVDFVDIDPETYNMSVTKLEDKLKHARETKTLPKVVIPVHFSGQSCDMEAIHELSQQYSFRIIEDASHAIGGRYKGEHVGCCRFSDISVFSFHPVKIITTAEGGAALTNDPQLASQLNLYRSHGIIRENADRRTDGPWQYEQIALGYNYRMTDLQAALGISQVNRLDYYIDVRKALAKRYDEKLAGTNWRLPKQQIFQTSAHHLYVLRLPNDNIEEKAQCFAYLHDNGIGVNVHYIPVHTQPYYKEKNINYGQLKNSEQYYKSAITIPLHPRLTHDEQDYIIQHLKLALQL